MTTDQAGLIWGVCVGDVVAANRLRTRQPRRLLWRAGTCHRHAPARTQLALGHGVGCPTLQRVPEEEEPKGPHKARLPLVQVLRDG